MKSPLSVNEDRLALAERLLRTTHMTTWDVLAESARLHPDRPAVALDPVELTFGELMSAALRSASRLQRLGVSRSTRVGLIMGTSVEWAVVHYALARLGAVIVPVNLAFEPPEIRHVLAVSEVEVLISVESHRSVDFAAHLDSIDPAILRGEESSALPNLRATRLLPVDGDRIIGRSPAAMEVLGTVSGDLLDPVGAVSGADPAYILFTSGSTAFPKATVCRHRALTGAATGFAHALGLTPEDRLLGVLPTFHTGGITCSLTAPHIAGACVQLLDYFDAGAALAMIDRNRCTATIAFDTMFVRMQAHPSYATADHTSLRRAALGATPAFIESLVDQWGFDRIVTTYGSTESGALAAVTISSESDRHVRHHTNGRPLPGVDFVIIDPETKQPVPPSVAGEICFRGWNLFSEYLGDPSATKAAIDERGYFHTGDYGSMDEEGRLTLLGRYKMMIKTGGENVAEREVEMLLEDDPCVELAQVVGAPSAEWGESVVAFVQLTDSAVVDELRDRCRGRMARFKIPRYVFEIVAGEWPMLQNGKPDKAALRRRALELTSGA